MTTISPTRPPNGNPGIVPPWLQHPPITILPMPDGWQDAPTLEAKIPTGTIVKVGR